MSDRDGAFKIVLLGDTTRKTTLVNRYLTKMFDDSIKITIGADFYVKDLEIDGKRVVLRIWDFGVEQRFKVLLPSFVKGADGALFIYDIANLTSINNIDDWLSVIRKDDRAEIPILLVGIMSNKKNKRRVSAKKGIKIAKSKNLNGFIECNLKTGENVDKAFQDLSRLVIVDRIKKLEEELRYWRSQSENKTKIKEYKEFIVYDLENTGNRTKLNITPEELQNHLNPKKVLIIISNRLKRIYIWKGAKSHVRKKFISSRIAQDLQSELIQDPRYNRCKIISIDQGRELQEFLNAFRLESMEVTDTLPDMRYPRNFKRDKGDLKFLEEKLNIYGDLLERMMSVILRIPDLVDRSLETVNHKLSTLESRINGTTNQKSTTSTKDGDQPTSPSSDHDLNFIILTIKDKDSNEKGDENDDSDDYFPYPYIFKPPNPPDDFEMAPQLLIRAPLKEKEPEEEIFCQYCGMKLTKEEHLNHSCKKKPE